MAPIHNLLTASTPFSPFGPHALISAVKREREQAHEKKGAEALMVEIDRGSFKSRTNIVTCESVLPGARVCSDIATLARYGRQRRCWAGGLWLRPAD